MSRESISEDSMATNPSQPTKQPPAPVNSPINANVPDAANRDRPVRILVQTKTQLVPGDKSDGFDERIKRMVNMICRRVWQRDYDRLRERMWFYRCEFAVDNRPCWFLVDHHGPDPEPIPYPPVVWYRWIGSDLSVSQFSCHLPAGNADGLSDSVSHYSVAVQKPLPRSVRRKLRYYPFKRLTAEQLNPPRLLEPLQRPKFSSIEEEMRHRREDLRSTLACGLSLLSEHVKFVQDHPKHAEWVKERVPPEAWARLGDPSQIVQYERFRARDEEPPASLDLSNGPES
jgi:hypothetical protein